jgi:hypothetical protein
MQKKQPDKLERWKERKRRNGYSRRQSVSYGNYRGRRTWKVSSKSDAS